MNMCLPFLYAARYPHIIKTHTVRNMVNIEHTLVHTTSWVANCPSLFMERAMTALDTATGEPKRAMSAGNSSGPKLIQEVN